MRKNKLLLLLALLMTAATGAWAQSTTHVVNQDNVNTIFSGDGYTLGNAVKTGDVLDFQGTIDLETASHSLVINKQVTVKSSTKDAVLKLHTPAGDRTGNNPGSTFVINKAGSGTAVQDIRLENTGMWIFNTSNVTFTGVTFHVEGASVCSGVGHVALRYSDHITFDGCTVYTKNNGGSGCCVLTGSHDCTFKDTRFENAGSAGNVLYIGNPYNTSDMPAGYTMNNDNISVLNCTITAESSGAMSQFKIMDGLRHRIENCTVNFITSFGCAATASEDGFVIRNNTFTQGLSIPKASTVTGNSVTGNVTIYSNNATVSNTTVYLGSTITGNSILGKVTFSNNSKNNTLTRNVITSTDDYAVVMASTSDANNTVQYNTLKSAKYNGDEAVNPSTGTGNTISNNSNIALMLADGTQDAAKWTAKVGEGDAQPLPVAGLNEGDAVTLQYTGRLKVKGVTATSDEKPAAPSVTEVTTFSELQAALSAGKDVKLMRDIECTAEINITSGALTIDGNGRLLIATSETRAFKVGSSATVAFKNLALREFVSGGGPAINNFGKIVLDECTIGNCHVNNSNGGGAIENKGKLYAINTTFSNNYSGEIGGAINNYGGSLYMSGCKFINNYTTKSDAYYGGAIGINSGSEVRLINCSFFMNKYGTTTGYSDIGVFSKPTNYTIAGCTGATIASDDGDITTIASGTATLDYSDLSNISFTYNAE